MNRILTPKEVLEYGLLPQKKQRTARFTGKHSKRKQERVRIISECFNAWMRLKYIYDANSSIGVTIPIRLESVANKREHWTMRKFRNDSQCNVVEKCRELWDIPLPWRVTLTRIGPREKELDGDNLQSAFKAIRDRIARCVGVDDKEGRGITWEYRQEHGEYAIKIEIVTI